MFSLFTDSKRNKKDPDRNERIHSRETSKRYFQLRGQFGENTGIVEVNHKGMPGAICGDGFTDQDARFVCRDILNTG